MANFPKTDQELRNVHFSENGACFISWNTRFEIPLFALLPTIINIFFQMNRAALIPPPNYFMFSLLTCLFCCWPVSIVALRKSSEVGCADLVGLGNSFCWDWKTLELKFLKTILFIMCWRGRERERERESWTKNSVSAIKFNFRFSLILI